MLGWGRIGQPGLCAWQHPLFARQLQPEKEGSGRYTRRAETARRRLLALRLPLSPLVLIFTPFPVASSTLLLLLLLFVLAVSSFPGTPQLDLSLPPSYFAPQPPLMLMSSLCSTRRPLTKALSTVPAHARLSQQVHSSVPLTELPPALAPFPGAGRPHNRNTTYGDQAWPTTTMSSSPTSSSTTFAASSAAPQGNMILGHRPLLELAPVRNPARTVTVSSYNILSRHYLWESLYSYLPLEYTNWSERFRRLNQSFRDLSELSDIMCFQEMEYQVYHDHWKSAMEHLGYDSIFQTKPKPGYWKKSANMMDGVSIFYNRSKFDLLNFEQINLADHFKHSSIIDQTADTQTRLNVRNTVAVIAVLKHKASGEVLFVSNTHLYWSPKHDDVKLIQTYLLTSLVKHSIMRHYKMSIDEVDDMMRAKQGPNVVMVGDFNSNPSSMVYRFMSKGSVDKKQELKFNQDYGTKFNHLINNSLGKFKSPYKDLYSKGLFTKTTYTPKFRGVIDYIWFADCNNKYNFTKVLGDVDHSYMEHFKGFPNEDFPSDHIPILAQIEFK